MNKEKIEKELKSSPNIFILKHNVSAKADVWETFRLLFMKKDESDDGKSIIMNMKILTKAYLIS